MLNFQPIGIVLSCFIILLCLGVFMPYVQDAVGSDISVNADSLNSDITYLTVLTNILKIFTWTFGDLPFYLDAFLLLIRFAFYLALYKVIMP